MKTLFFGTPEFAVPTLAALCEAGYEPLWVTSQPARPVGRKRQPVDPPVAQWARQQQIEVLQPERVKAKEFLDKVEEAAVDVAVVVAFGQIFRRRLLELPRLGCLNLHASLLPKYRGAAPIQGAIAQGETTTGVTTMQMGRGLDDGPILLQDTIEIDPHETSLDLTPKLAAMGAQLMIKTLDAMEAGTLRPEPQKHEEATYAPRLAKEDGLVDWHRTAAEIYNHWRAFQPWPGLTTELGGKKMKIVAGRVAADGSKGPSEKVGLPGTLLGVEGDFLEVLCGDGTIFLLQTIQIAGKKPISAVDFMNGERLEPGARFTSKNGGNLP